MNSLANLQFTPATASDFERLVDIRLISMRPSLEALGRFNPERARARFAGEFAPEHTTLVFDQDRLIGCYALIPKQDQLYLGHFYLLPEHQGQGFGRYMLLRAIDIADNATKDMVLIVLNQSPAQAFYVKYGFVVVSSDEVETLMLRKYLCSPATFSSSA